MVTETITWTVKEVAELFDATHARIRKWLSDGSLSGYKVDGKWVMLDGHVEALFNRTAG